MSVRSCDICCALECGERGLREGEGHTPAAHVPSAENDRGQNLRWLSPSKQKPQITGSDKRRDPSCLRLCNHSNSIESSQRMSQSVIRSSQLSTCLPPHRNICVDHPSLTFDLSPHGLLYSSLPPASVVTHGICHQWKLLHLHNH